MIQVVKGEIATRTGDFLRQEAWLSVPYLIDETQEITRTYGATIHHTFMCFQRQGSNLQVAYIRH